MRLNQGKNINIKKPNEDRIKTTTKNRRNKEIYI